MPSVPTVEIGSVLAGGRAFAFATGSPLRLAVATLWRPALTARALALAPKCGAGHILEAPPFTLFGAERADEPGKCDGVLIVVGTGLASDDRADLLALARILGRSKVSRLVNFLHRLQGDDPEARRELCEELALHHYNLTRVASNIGTSRPTLYRYIKNLGIPIHRVPAALRDDDFGLEEVEIREEKRGRR
jgi:hypothetical protein